MSLAESFGCSNVTDKVRCLYRLVIHKGSASSLHKICTFCSCVTARSFVSLLCKCLTCTVNCQAYTRLILLPLRSSAWSEGRQIFSLCRSSWITSGNTRSTSVCNWSCGSQVRSPCVWQCVGSLSIRFLFSSFLISLPLLSFHLNFSLFISQPLFFSQPHLILTLSFSPLFSSPLFLTFHLIFILTSSYLPSPSFLPYPHTGLRGAIAYALCLHTELESQEKRQVLVTTTLIIVLFTLLFLGGSTMPLLKVLHC